MENAPVTIIVKAPNQQFEDQTIKCEITWTIERLKSYLSEVYPNKPKSDEQKLIYSGKLLRDSAVLKDVLRQYDDGQDTHTVHLVFTPKNQRLDGAASSTSSTSSAANVAAAAASANGLRQRHTASTTPSPGTSTTNNINMPGTNTLLANAHIAQQILLAQQFAMQNTMQQIYMQYMNHYMTNATTPPPPQPSPATTASASTPSFAMPSTSSHAELQQLQQQQQFYQYQQQIALAVAQQHQQQQQMLQQQQQQQAAELDAAAAAAAALHVDVGENANNNNNNNNAVAAAAAAGPNEEDADWLDMIYASTRLMVLVALVFFYSSPTRLLIVICFFLSYQLYRTFGIEWRRLAQIGNANRPANAVADNAAADVVVVDAAAANAAAAANDEAPRVADAVDGAAAGDGGNVGAVAAAAAAAPQTSQAIVGQDSLNQRMPVLALMRTFVMSFFASLVPETPHI